MADGAHAWACPQGHVDWKRPTPSDLAEAGEDVWFSCQACGAQWQATLEQRSALVRWHEVAREFAGLAAEVETLSRQVQQAADDSVAADERRRVRRGQTGGAAASTRRTPPCLKCGADTRPATTNDGETNEPRPVWRCIRCGTEVPLAETFKK